MKRYNIPTTPLVLGLILGLLMELFFLTSLASYLTPAEFLLRPRTAIIMGIGFLFLFWSLWPSIKELVRDERKRRTIETGPEPKGRHRPAEPRGAGAYR